MHRDSINCTVYWYSIQETQIYCITLKCSTKYPLPIRGPSVNGKVWLINISPSYSPSSVLRKWSLLATNYRVILTDVMLINKFFQIETVQGAQTMKHLSQASNGWVPSLINNNNQDSPIVLKLNHTHMHRPVYVYMWEQWLFHLGQQVCKEGKNLLFHSRWTLRGNKNMCTVA